MQNLNKEKIKWIMNIEKSSLSSLLDSCQNCINIAKLLYKLQVLWKSQVSQHFPSCVSSFLFVALIRSVQGSISYVSQLSRATRKRSRALTALRSFKNCDLPISTTSRFCCFRYFNRPTKIDVKNFYFNFFNKQWKKHACMLCFHHWSLCNYASYMSEE